MKCLKKNPASIGEAIETLKKGGVIAHAADTCFGLAADLMNEKAFRQLQKIKGRDAKKPMSIMLAAHLKPKISRYVRLNDFSEMVCEKLLPGPVTIVLPKGPEIPDYFFPEINSVGLRIPYDSTVNDLLIKFKGPIITTSANLSGQPVCCNCHDVMAAFENRKYKPDSLLEGEIQGVCRPSTVIELTGDQVTILREGPMEKAQLEAILGIAI